MFELWHVNFKPCENGTNVRLNWIKGRHEMDLVTFVTDAGSSSVMRSKKSVKIVGVELIDE